MAEKLPDGAVWKVLGHFIELQQAQTEQEHHDAAIDIEGTDAGSRGGWGVNGVQGQ